MARPEVGIGNWASRVRLAGGDKCYAYVPNALLIDADADPDVVATIVPGIRPWEPPIIDDPGQGGSDEAAAARGQAGVTGGFRRWTFLGDVPSAVQRLRGAGVPSQPVHVFFLDAGVGANPVYGNPVYGNPVYGNPVYGNPVYGNPVYGNPVYGNPVYGNPVYGNPVYGNPQAGAAGPPPPLPCCCDADPCQCRTTPPVAPASFVYPNPAYVATVYPGGEGLPYQLTGQRRSQARPLLGIDAARLGEVAAWDDAPVRIAVLDTGRPAGDAQLAVPPGNVLGDLDAGPDSDNDDYLDPVAGHGTFIGGLIARVAPGCGLMIKRLLSDYGDGDEQAIADAIEELIDPDRCGHRPPHLLSLSFSGYVLDDDGAKCLRNAIRGAGRKGIVVVASAGNDGVSRPAFPAAYTGVVGVGALGDEGPAPFSNWGSWVRACAPGVDVASTFYEYASGRERMRYGLDPDLFDGFATWSGTSFAAPVVVGVLARTMMDRGLSANEAVEAVIDQVGLFRLRCYGTVVNTLAVRPLCP